MLNALDDAVHLSADPPDHDPPQLSYTAHTGRRGRPRVDIEPELLEIALSMRGSTHLASVFGCAPRTIRRRALEYGLAEPGPPVYVDYTDDEGNTTRFFTAAIGDPSGLSDDELDAITRQILETFPAFGRRMIGGHMKHLGHDVPRRRIQESYTRVHGPPVHGAFGLRRIQRRVYSVPGPNSLCHHDGHHSKSIIYYLDSSCILMMLL